VQSADPALIAQLRTVLDDVAGIRLAVLFGSAVSGRARPDSDVDIAVLGVAHELDDSAEGPFTRALSMAARRNVDLIRLERASTMLKWQIASKGVPLVERTVGEFARFRAGAASEYLDFAPAFSYHGEIFRRKLIEQGRAT
jgi:predicted nucleotidyltransferase